MCTPVLRHTTGSSAVATGALLPSLWWLAETIKDCFYFAQLDPCCNDTPLSHFLCIACRRPRVERVEQKRRQPRARLVAARRAPPAACWPFRQAERAGGGVAVPVFLSLDSVQRTLFRGTGKLRILGAAFFARREDRICIDAQGAHNSVESMGQHSKRCTQLTTTLNNSIQGRDGTARHWFRNFPTARTRPGALLPCRHTMTQSRRPHRTHLPSEQST